MKRIVVVYDGDCGLCQAAVGKLLRRYGQRVHPVDFRTTDVTELCPGATAEQLAARMHVVDEGVVYNGAEGVVRLMQLDAVFRHLSSVYYIPLLRRFWDASYDWVSRHRFTLSKWMGRQPECSGSCDIHRSRS